MTSARTFSPDERVPLASARRSARIVTWPHALVAALASFSLFLGLANISSQGFSNYYYAAAVRSMMQNWHAFYFASLDSKGFVSIDKPPVGFWIQTGSALIFGYHGWSLVLPEAIAGAGSVVLVFGIVNRLFGAAAGIIAALAMTVSPINIAVARNNTPDGLLVFCLLAAALCFTIAIQRGRALWLVAAFALVGVGFNIKMMEAYLILPGMVIAYVLAGHSSFWRRVGHLMIASVALVVVSFSWATTVWLTPASQRPYVGSTKDNNIFSLIFGYNGINRLLPKGWSIFGITNGVASRSNSASRAGNASQGRLGENGAQGLFRLFDRQLGGQVGWLIPLALIGLFVAWGWPRWRKLDGRHTLLLMFGTWALVEIAFFSEAGFYHRYYLATLSPSIAVLSGIGVVTLWKLFRSSGWSAILLPATLAATAATQFHVLAIYPFWKTRIEPALIVGIATATVAFLVVIAIRRSIRLQSGRVGGALGLIAAVCLLTLFAAPGIWSYTTIDRGYEGALPVAGPDGAALSSVSNPKPTTQSASVDAVPHAKLPSKPAKVHAPVVTDSGRVMMAFLDAHQRDAAYLVAVPSSREADTIIVQTGAAVMTLGGFGGADPIVDVTKLRTLIKAKQIRYFLMQGGAQSLASTLEALTSKSAPSPAFGSPAFSHQSVATWVETTCPLVPPSTIAAMTPGAATTGLTGLYDCKGKGA